MGAELLQFAVFMGVFAVAAVLWLYVVYLPGRTLERWEDQRARVSRAPRAPQDPRDREEERV